MIEKITQLAAHTQEKTTSNKKVIIPSWCRELEIYNLRDKTIIRGNCQTKHERRECRILNQPYTNNYEDIITIEHSTARRRLNRITGTSRTNYDLVNNSNHKMQIITKSYRNILTSSISCCCSCFYSTITGELSGGSSMQAGANLTLF